MEIMKKLETVKENVNAIPVVGYDSCIKIVKIIAELLEIQQSIADSMEENKKTVDKTGDMINDYGA